MASSGTTLTLSLLVAGGAIVGGYYLSRRQKAVQAREQALVELPLARVSSSSLDDYCRERNKSYSDYLAVPVRGCPPKAPAEAAALIEAVVDYRRCEGTGLIPKAPRPGTP
ncbi:MAG: hypothetical protein PHU21_05095 [Elusimicrobia bacterium]|nr:hypothetical protein [Elusimicrobiota bacterium]